MAGHSKWANIKHRKARQDASRGKVWTKVIREITVAAKDGPDPNDNPRLRLALEKANSANMPKDTIKRAIEKGSGTGETGALEEIIFEGYGPGGVAILVETMTDNRNRTVSDVRHAFSKFGGNLGTDGSVAYLFKKLGLIHISKEISDEDLMDLVIESGANDYTEEEDFFEVTTEPNDFNNVLELVDSTSDYALTGAVYSQDRYALDTAMKKLENSAGNFYINDKPTGAVVGQQPFGGARGSGTNDKAGSYLNLLRWVSPRTVKEALVPAKDYRYPFLG